jgi:hypothetical protein
LTGSVFLGRLLVPRVGADVAAGERGLAGLLGLDEVVERVALVGGGGASITISIEYI